MSVQFFGEYLVHKQVITIDQLESAIRYQKQGNQQIGRLAVQCGYMSEEQVEKVIALQSRINDKFGQIAIQQNFLSRGQLEKLLTAQAENYIYLGEVISKMGIKDSQTINTHLNQYRRETNKHNIHFDMELNELPENEVLRHLVDSSVNYFFRLGVMVKKDALIQQEELPKDSPMHSFFAKQMINRQDYFFGIIIPDALLAYFVETILGDESRNLSVEEKNMLLDEVVYNLNYVICNELKKKGYNAKYGASGYMPKEGRQVAVAVVQLKTVIEPPFFLVYYQ
jgi:hypothetical protein